jgi:hypothetical protein
MKIELVGILSQELKDLKLKPGYRFDAEPAPGTRIGAMRFQTNVQGQMQYATVFPGNFKKV